MSHAQAKIVIDHVYKRGQLMSHSDAGGLILHINSDLGAFSVRRDGACVDLRPGAKYGRDGQLYIEDSNKPTFMVPHDYPKGWHDKFFKKFVPALDDPSRDLDELLENLLKEPQSRDTPRVVEDRHVVISNMPGWLVLLIVVTIIIAIPIITESFIK
jgi:hypothetical protein